jgi:hypothetical protein
VGKIVPEIAKASTEVNRTEVATFTRLVSHAQAPLWVLNPSRWLAGAAKKQGGFIDISTASQEYLISLHYYGVSVWILQYTEYAS